MTTVSIVGREFHIDGTPTYAGRQHEGLRVQGLLFNVRAVQATFDDVHPETRALWAYPDTGRWDAERNVSEFCAALPSWRDHGVLAFTINFQGGGALYSPEIYRHYDNSGYTPDGHLKAAYAERIARVLACADALGMVPIVGLFYAEHLRRMEGEKAMRCAADESLAFLANTGFRNLLIEVANEADVVARHANYEQFRSDQVHHLLDALRAEHPKFLYGCSLGGANPETGQGMPPESLVAASDYAMLHGNGALAPMLGWAIQAVQAMPAFREHPKPLLINEDSSGIPNLEVSWRNYVSWGYYDQGYGGAAGWSGDAYVDYRAHPREGRWEDLSGFQTPPVNWGINTDLKRAFFERVAEITGYPGARGR